MYQIKAKIILNKKIIPEHYKICLDAPEIAGEAKPGQFVHIRAREGYDPLLRRPFSIHKSQGEKIEILYKVVGKGTQLLSRKKIGKKIDILGPLGQGFKVNPGLEKVILVAGGIGVAPLYFLAERLAGYTHWKAEKGSKRQSIINDSSINKNQLDILVLLGAETKEKILCLEDFKNLNVKIEIATEDGSESFKGLVSDLFFQLLSKESQVNLVCACGPALMLKRIAELNYRYKIPCQVSLEQRMGCGIGACLGCTIKGQTGYLRVCRNGPVFEADEIQWNEI